MKNGTWQNIWKPWAINPGKLSEKPANNFCCLVTHQQPVALAMMDFPRLGGAVNSMDQFSFDIF
jgi:hypothetical protein